MSRKSVKRFGFFYRTLLLQCEHYGWNIPTPCLCAFEVDYKGNPIGEPLCYDACPDSDLTEDEQCDMLVALENSMINEMQRKGYILYGADIRGTNDTWGD